MPNILTRKALSVIQRRKAGRLANALRQSGKETRREYAERLCGMARQQPYDEKTTTAIIRHLIRSGLSEEAASLLYLMNEQEGNPLFISSGLARCHLMSGNPQAAATEIETYIKHGLKKYFHDSINGNDAALRKLSWHRYLRLKEAGERKIFKDTSLHDIIRAEIVHGMFLRYDVLYRVALLEIADAKADCFHREYMRMQAARLGNQTKYSGDKFKNMADAIGTHGFDRRFPVPLSSGGNITGGSHRPAAALYHNMKTIPTVTLPWAEGFIDYGRGWIEKNGGKAEILEQCDIMLEKILTAG